LADILVDVSADLGLKGKLLLGFSSPQKEDINEIEVKYETKWQLDALRRFMSAKNRLFEDYDIDILLLDTSPGIRYWSINSLAAADTLFLLMKMSDMDIEGTLIMTKEIYDSLARFGSKYYIILNKVQGAEANNESLWQESEKIWKMELERNIGAQVIAAIPCFCDVQFSRHEFLFAINQPDHPFSKKLVSLAEKIVNLP
jgi:MinD-like ATPase involved in chromosome partitioning or flagellar assembly